MNTVILGAALGPADATPLERLPGSVEHMIHMLNPLSVFGSAAHPVKIGVFELTLSVNFIWFLIAAAILLWLGLSMRKRVALVPKGRGVNAFEFLVEFVRNNVANMIKHDQEKYEPFILTTFFFILICNLSGLVPGGRQGTGTIGGTLALSITVLIYFNYAGMKAKGVWNYIKGIVPNGVPGALGWLIWIIEVISMCLRPVTLALRLWANMYAGHIILGIFALLTGLFAEATIAGMGPYIAASPAWMLLLFAIYFLEIMVCFIGAYVFCLLTSVYIDAATGSH